MTASPPLDPAAVPAQPLGVRVRNHRGSIFVARAQHAFELSDSAAFIWGQIDGNTTLGDIGQRLAEEYGITADEAVADAVDLVRTLVEHGLMTIRGPG
jgi:pyrroloquinoline quinone biosynthesis protein D